jgi:hypothetical protein
VIYKLGLGAEYENDFHDIIAEPNGFLTTKDYDLASGWGSPKESCFIKALVGTE